jgi:hypothetical protein
MAMRAVRVYLTLLLLLLVSAAAGIIASDWPSWCHAHHWCAAGFPTRAGAAQLGRQALK